MASCATQPLLFPDLGTRKVVVDFSAADLASDGGIRLLHQIDHGPGVSHARAHRTFLQCWFALGSPNGAEASRALGKKLRCAPRADWPRLFTPSQSSLGFCALRPKPEQCSWRIAAVAAAHSVRRTRGHFSPALLVHHSGSVFEPRKRRTSAPCGRCEPPGRRRSDCIVPAKGQEPRQDCLANASQRTPEARAP